MNGIFSLLTSSPKIVSGAHPYMAQGLVTDQNDDVFDRDDTSYIPHDAIEIEADQNDFTKGSKAREAVSMSCDIPQAVVMAG